MRVCWNCQQVNGDSDERCGNCGGDIALLQPLPGAAPLARRPADYVTRRNRGYMLLLVILPYAVALVLWFWTGFIPALFKDADTQRRQLLTANQRQIEAALDKCLDDTGGVPTRLAVLQQYGITPGDLTPGAVPRRWNGPYLPAGAPFPINPYRARDGIAGWHYRVIGTRADVTPVHASR
jgi:hypothetical protein